MNINIKGTNMDLTLEIKSYVSKRINSLDKFFKSDELDSITVLFEVARKSGQKSGDVFHADCVIEYPGEKFYAASDQADVFAAIDEVKDNLSREIRRNKKKKLTLLHRGGRKIKSMLKSASSYRPWRK